MKRENDGLVEEQKPLKAEATKPNASIATGAKKSVAIGAISVGQFLKELNTFLDMIGELRKNDLDSFQRGIAHAVLALSVVAGLLAVLTVIFSAVNFKKDLQTLTQVKIVFGILVMFLNVIMLALEQHFLGPINTPQTNQTG